MQLGWIGLGKLGLPCALALNVHFGHQVAGYDVSELPAAILAGSVPPPDEDGIGDLLAHHSLKIAHSVADVVAASEIVFVAVQTPHAPEYGGEIPAPFQRRDFEYAYLTQAVREVCRAAQELGRHITVAVVSTVLPGTCERWLASSLNEYTRLVYNPAFVAMGTAIKDFLSPEFVLLGGDRNGVADVAQVYAMLGSDKIGRTSIESAELIKVAYNTFISSKIVFANTLMEICHHTGADVDEVTEVLAKADQRLLSPRYLSAGMGDGGACHPRDLIATSWLAERLGLSYDLLGELAGAREAQTRWLAQLTADYAAQTGLAIVVCGKAYKPQSTLTAGSPALLLAHYLQRHTDLVTGWDPYVDERDRPPLDGPGVFVIATRHDVFAEVEFYRGSVVIDPWGYIPDQPGVTVIRVGRKT